MWGGRSALERGGRCFQAVFQFLPNVAGDESAET